MAIHPETSSNSTPKHRRGNSGGVQAASTAIRPRVHGRPWDAEDDALTVLLARVARREVAAFATLYDLTSARLFGVAVRVLRDPLVAQQTILQVYLDVWADAHRFDSCTSSPEAWLTALTQRHAVERVRREPGRNGRMLACNNGNDASGVLDEVLDHMACAGDDALNEPQRATVALAYYGGLTYREVAVFLGVPLPTITSRIRTGLARLGESLRTT